MNEKSRDYWSSRLADKVYIKHSVSMKKAVKKAYSEQVNKIKSAIAELYADMLADGEISTTNLYKYGRYSELIREINKITGEFAEEELKVLNDELEQAYIETFEKTSETFGNDIKWGLQNKYFMEEALNGNFHGKNFSSRVWTNRNKMSKILEQSIQDIVASGRSKDDAVKEMIQRTGQSFTNADRLIRTETMRVINAGQQNSYMVAGYTRGYYLVADDERLCDECLEWERRTKDNPMPLDEMESIHHPNCRCTIIPVTEDKRIYDYTKEELQQRHTSSKIISGALNPESKEANKHAKRYYEEIRKRKKDCTAISERTGFTEEFINKVKNYLFIEKHDLGNGELEYFYPDYEIAQSWQRLSDKNMIIQDHDLILLQHEHLERELIRKGFSQQEAHRKAEEKYNYAKALKERN
nr:MAG TPA: minor capsid protein [Caudoviricetes sp.]